MRPAGPPGPSQSVRLPDYSNEERGEAADINESERNPDDQSSHDNDTQENLAKRHKENGCTCSGACKTKVLHPSIAYGLGFKKFYLFMAYIFTKNRIEKDQASLNQVVL